MNRPIINHLRQYVAAALAAALLLGGAMAAAVAAAAILGGVGAGLVALNAMH
jgi:hypothetical protein